MNVEPIRGGTGAVVADACAAGLKFFADRRRLNDSVPAPTFVRIDNASSTELIALLNRRSIQLNYVPVGHHGANRAEKAIQDFEAHMLSTLATAADDYPRHQVARHTVAIAFAEDTCKLSQSKSIDIRFHWIRDRIKQGHFTLAHVPGVDNIADFFTKSLAPDDHHRWLPMLVQLGPQGSHTVVASIAPHWRKGA